MKYEKARKYDTSKINNHTTKHLIVKETVSNLELKRMMMRMINRLKKTCINISMKSK
jgi:hypothetical protein